RRRPRHLHHRHPGDPRPDPRPQRSPVGAERLLPLPRHRPRCPRQPPSCRGRHALPHPQPAPSHDTRRPARPRHLMRRACSCTPASPPAPAILAPQLDATTARAIAERPDLCPGVRIETFPTRAYPRPEGVLVPHALGYLAQATEEDVKASDGAISSAELVGSA